MRDGEDRQNQLAVFKVQLVSGSEGLLQGPLSRSFTHTTTTPSYSLTHPPTQTHTHSTTLHHCSLSGSKSLCILTPHIISTHLPFFTFAVSVIFSPSPFLIHWLTMMNFSQLYRSWQKKFAQQSFESEAKRVQLMILVQVQHGTL